ncbi:Hypothetical protein MAU_4840 [Metamycoplasma auris 15026]|uniref:Uncharacterized protein n=1 Tax=Metamycoplasma auris 15026 TaxID=1188233 RepID=N9VAL3_9BACT|nr:hypothetical protein [Metamycoplasma auris]ENY68688.1 Hypothetical protein MAU_4840 [Metamycoplasma auris 15026]
MNNSIIVNTKLNFDFKVDIDAIYQTVNDFFSKQNSIILVKKPELNINKNGLDLIINCTLQENASLSFETNKMIFLLEQRIYSLINSKPNNIKIIFESI